MARTVVGSAVIVREKYYWPDAQLNFWTIIMLAASGLILGVFAEFMQIQSQMRLPTPWIMPYGVTVGALTIIFVIVEMILIAQRKLLPGIMMLLSFILLVLYITGAVGTGIQLFGGNNINNQCNAFVFNAVQRGPNEATLAWLQQRNICQCWQAAFSFWIIGAVFFIWMIVIAAQVNQNSYE
ncbi:hypothetical protein K491DRAFT_41591 [Lophiostoma macrostomum CBS 122681]|uniref:MARVEL domain-containing protein n=1 Tax=Lophiostoma macrostomum CBS 122681 TaxID=1314788 RepID=A0A6A6TL10_9PLEO|nr:hypothetical protein K491DRAFT_41591 [Lophiostoma macrostomum CBS 122681]